MDELTDLNDFVKFLEFSRIGIGFTELRAGGNR